jgi:hypothetical protein
VLWLTLAIALLLSLSHGLLEPLLGWGTPLLELRSWPWLALVIAAFLLAGSDAGRKP